MMFIIQISEFEYGNSISGPGCVIIWFTILDSKEYKKGSQKVLNDKY